MRGFFYALFSDKTGIDALEVPTLTDNRTFHTIA